MKVSPPAADPYVFVPTWLVLEPAGPKANAVESEDPYVKFALTLETYLLLASVAGAVISGCKSSFGNSPAACAVILPSGAPVRTMAPASNPAVACLIVLIKLFFFISLL